MSRPIRVLHVLGTMDHGGIETWLMHVLRHIDRSNFQLDFCCLAGQPGFFATEIEALGSRIYSFRLSKNLPRFNDWFAQLLAAGEYDIVHSHVHHFSGYILWLAARHGVENRIAHSFTTAQNQTAGWTRQSYEAAMHILIRRYATAGLGNSTLSLRSLFGEDWETDTRWQLLYCGIDLAPFRQPYDERTTTSRFGIPAEATVIGHMGRLTPAKNHAFFLDIAHEICRYRRDVWFLIMGDGLLRGPLERSVRQKGLDRVVFSGRVTDAEVVLGLRRMDLLLFPSLWEGLPQSVLEAQAAGTRCLCSEAVTSEVVVIPSAVRFMSLSKNAKAWADACLEFVDQPRLDKDKVFLAMANSPFAIERSVDGLCRVYRNLSPLGERDD